MGFDAEQLPASGPEAATPPTPGARGYP
jgi:hypothetical protein